ncbi:hypothetical protein GCM10011610_30650 [Nocardia rhizosphaerihabitans]|uniref:Uncharacterized protein n=1 Tax=Nocardia rhizosphaerihabitans TaxID=1691570 RepID=A0ABQ2KF27_9NOCA|nr:hypothetical protein GCM10011610_30650 [Nocardia rhizosphaerihabitans]
MTSAWINMSTNGISSETPSAVQVQRALGHIVEHPRHRHLDGRDVLAHLQVVLLLVDAPGGVQHQEPELLQIDPAVGDPLLHRLQRAEGSVAHLPRDGAFAHHVEGLAYQGDSAHGVMHTSAAEACLGHRERTALGTEQMVDGHPDVGVSDIALVVAEAVYRDIAHDLEPGRARGHEEHRHALIGTDLGVGDRHDNEELGEGRHRVEPLLAVDDPAVPVAHRRGGEQGGIGAGLRLGHRVAGADLTVEQWLKVLPTLLGPAIAIAFSSERS